MRGSQRLSVALLLGLPWLGWSQQNIPLESPQIKETVAKPQSSIQRSPPDTAVGLEGLVRLDVVVTNQAGVAVSGLERSDFKLLDNGQPQKIVAFRASHNGSLQFEPPVAVILLIDTLDLPPDLAASEREQAVKFLHQTARSLTEPVTIYSLDDSGFWQNTKPSLDGNTLARDLESDRKVDLLFAPPGTHSPFKHAIIDKTYSQYPPLTALRAIGTIAAAEYQNPGRKVLLWIGTGLNDRGSGAYLNHTYYYRNSTQGFNYTDMDLINPQFNPDIFDKIYWLSLLLREARVSIDSFSVGEYEWSLTQSNWMLEKDAWKQFLTGVTNAGHANVMNLYKKVIAVQSGGRVLPPEEDLAKQMAACVEQASDFYTLTFNPPLAANGNEYHTLKVELSQPGLTARTNTGYYDEPFYDDPPDPKVRRVTVAQLEQIIREMPRNHEAEQLANLRLTERLSNAQLASLTAVLHGKNAREALEAVADQSALLGPPPSEIPADPPPDAATQQRMLAAAVDYLTQTISTLPNFFATRRTVSFGETPAYHELNTNQEGVPIHVEERSVGTVLYRDGAEVVNTTLTQRGQESQALITSGIFGPLLRNTLRNAMELTGGVTWSRWEQAADGRRAVFRFLVPPDKTQHLRISGCCVADGRANPYAIVPGYHGQITVDPSNGAILRVEIEADLPGFVPVNRSEIMVAYGPVEIGGKTYILPIRSASIWRGRRLEPLKEWNESFMTWGPYETRLNEFTFDQYHMFHGEARMLPGYTPAPNN
jgi:VWFA-related protein